MRSPLLLSCLSLVLAASLTDAAPGGKPPAKGDGDKPAGEKPPQQRFEDGMMVRFHMHENYGIVRGIERLLLRGRIEEARPLAAAVGEAPDEPGATPFAKHSAEIRRRALELSRAKTVEEAFRLEGKLVVACAACHVEANVVPDLSSTPLPADRDSLEARMARHLWAADRLWVGIVADSQDAWASGLDLLATGSKAWPDLPAARAPLARQMQRTAQTARRVKAPSLDERGTTYGELLATCASCHTAR